MASTDLLTRVAGFDYSKGTAKGFDRQRVHGAVTPPIRVIQSSAQMMERIYDKLIDGMAKLARQHTALIEDAITPGFSQTWLRWMRELSYVDKVYMVKKLYREFTDARRSFFKDFVEANKNKIGLKVSFALDRDDVFSNRLDRIQLRYLDNAIERIQTEENVLKKAFLTHYTGFITGQSVDFESLDDIVERMKKTSVREAKFFARDQYSRFNKALALASYDEADVKYVKWLTVGDFRVRGRPGGAYPLARPSHWKLQGKIYRMDQIPNEIHDYNCFLPGTIIQGSILSGLKSTYSGTVWEINTARGNILTITPNHRILTDKGWICANKLEKGMNSIGYFKNIHSLALANINNQNEPAAIENIFNSLWPGRAKSMGASLNLDSDIGSQNGKVDIVWADRNLRITKNTETFSQIIRYFFFSIANQMLGFIKRLCSKFFSIFGINISSSTFPRSRTLFFDKIGTKKNSFPLKGLRLGLASYMDTVKGESSKQSASIIPSFITELFEAGAGNISFDEIVNIRNFDYSGHVYDLQAVDGYVIADGIVSSNCRCALVPATEKEYNEQR